MYISAAQHTASYCMHTQLDTSKETSTERPPCHIEDKYIWQILLRFIQNAFSDVLYCFTAGPQDNHVLARTTSTTWGFCCSKRSNACITPAGDISCTQISEKMLVIRHSVICTVSTLSLLLSQPVKVLKIISEITESLLRVWCFRRRKHISIIPLGLLLPFLLLHGHIPLEPWSAHPPWVSSSLIHLF